jgi:catechol 2,3-dioxygenase
VTAATDPQTTLGRVALTVRDLAAVREFYERVVGLTTFESEAGRAVLGAGELALVELVEDRAAPPRPPRTTGLFHLAVLVPDRVELARSLSRLVEARQPLQGASDHLVSEALYLADPEGNGIEIYRDRPQDEWRRDGDEIAMATLPLDLNDLLAELERDQDGGGEGDGVPPGTRIGHVHLNVADLDDGERFYSGELGLDVTARGYPGALFLAAGGYHHHLGLNIWRGAGAPQPPPVALGLRWFELAPPSVTASEDLADPSGNVVRLRA